MTEEALERGAALAWATHLREVRAFLSDALGSARVTLDEVLAERTDPGVACVHVLTVLESMPGARKIDTRRALAEAGIALRTPLGDMSDDEVAYVANRFPIPATGDVG